MGGSGKKRDKDHRIKHKNLPENSSDAEPAPKKMKKHKHKRTRDKLAKKERHKQPDSPSMFMSDSINDDEDLILSDKEQTLPHSQMLSAELYSSQEDHIELTEDGDIVIDINKKADFHKSKKNKKKDKNKERGEKSSRKDKKNIKRDVKMEIETKSESSGNKKESKTEKKNANSNKDEDGTDSEEERWLHAIEAGKLEEVDDELKRIRNPRLLTARQRALLEKQRIEDDIGTAVNSAAGLGISSAVAAVDGSSLLQETTDDIELQQQQLVIPPEPLLALPSGFKEKIVTQEMLEKKAIKSQRRRAQALEKREEDKKKTVDRLLKKQDSKLLKSGCNKKNIKSEVAMFSYQDNRNGVNISLPFGTDYPIVQQVAPIPPSPILCGVEACSNVKRYNCNKTGIPLCSLQCYKTNLTKIVPVM